MKRIESSKNPLIQATRNITNRKSRARATDKFLLEGKKLILESIDSNVQLQDIFATQEFWDQELNLLQTLQNKNVSLYVVSPRLMKQISTMDTPPGIVGVALRPGALQTHVVSQFGCLLVSIRDPGNLGTILRSAEAGGCEFVACTDDCADPFQPKAVRASMGSVFRIPPVVIEDSSLYIRDLKQKGIFVYGLVPRAPTTLFEIKPLLPALIVIGSESHGIPAELELDAEISIPMQGKVESLNVAMAATLCFYHFSHSLSKSVQEHPGGKIIS